MQTFEFLASLKPATRELGALRWNVPATTPRVTAELLRTPKHAQRIFRSLSDDGAGPLVRALVEHAGGPIPARAAVADQAALIADRMLLIDDGQTWAIPADFALAMLKFAERERFYAGTLLSRVSDEELRTLAVDLGLRSHGSRASLVSGLSEALKGARDTGGDTRRAAETTVEIRSVSTAQLKSVHVVRGSGGCRFRLVLEGREVVVAPREVAEALGLTCEPASVEAPEPAPVAVPQREINLDLPPHLPVGALVVFSTARAADDAMRVAEFRALVSRRLDDRRVVTREAVSAEQAHRVLTAHGFGDQPPA